MALPLGLQPLAGGVRHARLPARAFWKTRRPGETWQNILPGFTWPTNSGKSLSVKTRFLLAERISHPAGTDPSYYVWNSQENLSR